MIKPANWSEERWELYLEECRRERNEGVYDEVHREANDGYREFMDDYDPRDEL